jgi:excinuclease UvrABC nuclease subunit
MAAEDAMPFPILPTVADTLRKDAGRRRGNLEFEKAAQLRDRVKGLKTGAG